MFFSSAALIRRLRRYAATATNISGAGKLTNFSAVLDRLFHELFVGRSNLSEL